MSEIDRIYKAIESLLCVPSAPVIPDVWFCVYGLHSAFDQLALTAVRGVEGGFVWHSSGIEKEAVGFGNQPNLVPAWISHVESPLMVEENLRCARSIPLNSLTRAYTPSVSQPAWSKAQCSRPRLNIKASCNKTSLAPTLQIHPLEF